jgi:WhiB family transcriptional regulator, redox-sensing transcriptional regulator
MSWYQQARCHRHDPEIFFDTRKRAERRAKAICSKCTVQQECLAFALQSGTEFGIWGGLNADERRVLMVRMKRTQEMTDLRLVPRPSADVSA